MTSDESSKPTLPETRLTPDRKSFAADMSRFLNADRYIDYLSQIREPKQRPKVIGLTLEYGILHPDLFRVEDFLRGLKIEGEGQEAASWLMANSVADKLDVDLDLVTSKEKIFDYFVKQTVTDGVYYHGFNGVFEDQITKQGLSPGVRLWDWAELEKVAAIGAKAGNGMLLGWGMLNSKGRTSYTATTRDVYRYATASPEWFAQFVAEGFHIPIDPAKKEAFYRRNYKTARQNVIDVCNRMQSAKAEDVMAKKAYPNMSDEDRESLLNFFEKYWNLLVGPKSQPCVALIEREAVLGGKYPSETFAHISRVDRKTPEDEPISDAIDFMRAMDGMHIDQQTKLHVPPSKIAVVRLPEYTRVFPS